MPTRYKVFFQIHAHPPDIWVVYLGMYEEEATSGCRTFVKVIKHGVLAQYRTEFPIRIFSNILSLKALTIILKAGLEIVMLNMSNTLFDNYFP